MTKINEWITAILDSNTKTAVTCAVIVGVTRVALWYRGIYD